MNICRYCECPIDPVDEVRTLSYWNQFPFVCHRDCKKEGERQEAIDCQTIDADCNDCLHFQRNGKTDAALGRKATANYGDCLKFSKPTTAYPKMWTGLECFEHRRA